MSESTVLRLVLRYPNPVAVARRVNGATLGEGIRRLECAGLVVRRHGAYRVTKRGRTTLEFDQALQVLVGRALACDVELSG